MSEAIITSIIIGCICLGPFLGGMAMEWIITKQQPKENQQ
jgi:uncharacterized protein YqgC (DUF456 family)